MHEEANTLFHNNIITISSTVNVGLRITSKLAKQSVF